MTPADTGKVLMKVAAYDQRTVGAADIAAWHEVIGGLDLGDCLNAVTVHYREQSTRAMPADIRKLALGIRDARQARERQTDRRLAIEAGPTTRDRSPEVTALVQSVIAALPKADVHERALARARKERGRPSPELRQATAKQRKKTKKPKDYEPPVSDEIAALATRYLIDGYAPADVADRLCVSRRWCERTARKFRPATEETA